MLRTFNGCAHEWFIALTESEDEAKLDLTLFASMQAILATSRIAVFSVKKALKEQSAALICDNLSCLDFSSQDIDNLYQKLQDNKIHISESLAERVSYIPICHGESVIGFVVAAHELGDIASTKQLNTAINVLHIYANQQHILFKNRLDPLTELLNRQTFNNKMMEVITGHDHNERRDQIDEHCAWYLAMLDIDNFKKVNDQFGHVIGDEVLILMAGLMKCNFRSEDYIFRYGGEEFSVLFKCADESTAEHILERLRETIAGYNFPQAKSMTMSIGFTELKSCTLIPKLVQQADLALYHSKESGRNSVTNFKIIAHLHNIDYVTEHELFK
ncbi:GGDEF domain-containing protein [Moritella marina ATCC 15381]|uniref:diguanylate cyclase n=1 Tax=Moritella marina ATCC 15381 TaxID=1202962 RepID=A0A5J6WLI9_MORMI|nr:GGDEF domain-containing protein [Moritella marina]QFI37332.1 GGDEF domain-containing protein [Moritella marina ATCC 15381]